MATNETCQADSGSMTDCQPLCDKPATHAVQYTNGRVFTSKVCERHLRREEARVYPGYQKTWKL